MNELTIMSIPDIEDRPWYIYDKTLRKSFKNSYQSYELAELALQDLVQTGKYWSKHVHPDASGKFEN